MAIPRDRLEMSKLHPAYVAGFIDGEGCIRIDKSKSAGRSTCYKIEIIVANNDQSILLQLQEQYGGYMRHSKFGTQKAYYWSLYGSPAETFLYEILPYLQVKLEQAEAALEFQKVKTKAIPAPGKRLSEEELTLRDSYYWRIKELKSSKPVTTTKGHLSEMMV